MDTFDIPARSRQALLQRLGAVLWPSFLVAAAASVLFFAFIDPLKLQQLIAPGHGISRELGYSVGFFLAWLGTLSACGLTALLLSPPRRKDADEDDAEPPLE